MRRILLVLLLGLTVGPSPGADWPMWRHDVGRTAESPQELPGELSLLWHRELRQPVPAFRDVRLQFDGGYEPIVKGQRLFLSSNCEDKVMAFETDSGELEWEFFTDGPVRLAPVAWKDRVLFGSDDGFFYCVRAGSGELVWKVRAVPSRRKLIGNRRLISVWPVRGGPVVQNGRVYFAAGVWPFEGVFICCLDAATGERIWVNDSSGHLYGQQPHNAVAIGGIAPQGYLLIDGEDLVVPSSNAYPGRFDLKTGELKDFKLPLGGRFPGGWYASLAGESEEEKSGRKSLLADLGINVMRHEDRLRAEGQPEVRTTIRAAGREFNFEKGFPGVSGEIHSMVVADDKLFVTTVEGGLYAFGEDRGVPARNYPLAKARGPGDGGKLAEHLVEIAPRHGHAVLLGAPEFATLAELVSETELRVTVVESVGEQVDQLRRALSALGVYGSRVAVLARDPASFEMPPYFAHVVFVRGGVSLAGRDRIFESVRPYGGKLIEQSPDGLKVTVREGALPGSTNYLGDFKPSRDELVKAPLGVLWFDDALGHFKRSPQPKFVDGVMVSSTKDWLDPSKRTMKNDYRLLPPSFSDVYTGRVLSDEETADLKTRSYAKVDEETIQPSQYRPERQKNAWKPEPPVAGHRQNPLTGETEPRAFPKSYGCDGGFDYGHVYTMRSGTASFYDKRIDSGTINISGPRSGCTNSIVPANGLLNLPYYYKGCTCSYPLPTGLAMYHLPESHEQWMTWGAIEKKKLAGRIRRVGINLGAPADRMTESGTLWLDYPSGSGPSPELDVVTVPAAPDSYYHHSVWMKGGEGLPWVAASGVEGIESITVRGVVPGRYRVKLIFANPREGERRFDVRIQGRTARENLALREEMVAKSLVIDDVESKGGITIEFMKGIGNTQLSGLEIILRDRAE